MFTAGIELFFGMVTGAIILMLGLAALTMAYYGSKRMWDRLTTFPGLWVVIALVVVAGLLLQR